MAPCTIPQWTVVGPLWIADDGSNLDVMWVGNTTLRFGGALREMLKQGRFDHPHFAALRSINPQMGKMLDAFAEHTERPLVRSDVLRGTGYDILFVELTAQCNERCSHCYADASPERTAALPWPVLEALIRDAAALGFRAVQLTGGDPLLHPSLPNAAQLARACGIPTIEIYTNGLALTEHLLDRLAPLGVRFAFSLYSHRSDVHDEITGVPGSHGRTLRAVRACLARALRVRIGVTLFEPNAEHEDAIKSFLHENGVSEDAVSFAGSHKVGRGTYFARAADEAHHGGTRRLGTGKACVTPDGDVVPCIFARDLVLGSLTRASLREILERDDQVNPPLDVSYALSEANTRLSCSECQLRDALLGSTCRKSPLVQLRSKP